MNEPSDLPLEVEPDGLYTPDIKSHSLEKIRLHNRYASIFASGMWKKWPQLAYVGLYSGCGHARVVDVGLTVETSALAVLRQPIPFSHYIYVDHDPNCIKALSQRIDRIKPTGRVTLIEGDVNGSVDQVRNSLPPFSAGNGLLSFCFVDPFDLQLRFDSIRQLSHLRMDFLVLLMLGVDGRRNFKRYLNDETSTRVGDLIDCPNWRQDFRAHGNVIHFMLQKFDQAMQRLDYLSAADDAHCVRVTGMGVLQYVLAFYSKSKIGQHFWRESRASLSPQLGLPF